MMKAKVKVEFSLQNIVAMFWLQVFWVYAKFLCQLNRQSKQKAGAYTCLHHFKCGTLIKDKEEQKEEANSSEQKSKYK